MDETELRTQLEQHDAVCLGWALNCCGYIKHDAEDVLQTAYQKVLQGQARYDGRSSFKTWLFAVIRRTALDERRRRWLRLLGLSKYTQEQEVQTETADCGNFPDQCQETDLAKKFKAGLLQLPKRQREALHLVFYQDLSLQEASSVMNVSIGSTRTHYERGKQNLRNWLKGQEVTYAN